MRQIGFWQALREGYVGWYTHVFLWFKEDIWEMDADGARRGSIYEYNDSSLQVEGLFVNATLMQQQDVIASAEDFVRRGIKYGLNENLKMLLWNLGIPIKDHLPPLPVCSTAIALWYLAGGVDLPGAAGVPLWRFTPGHMNWLRKNVPELVVRLGRLAFAH